MNIIEQWREYLKQCDPSIGLSDEQSAMVEGFLKAREQEKELLDNK